MLTHYFSSEQDELQGLDYIQQLLFLRIALTDSINAFTRKDKEERKYHTGNSIGMINAVFIYY